MGSAPALAQSDPGGVAMGPLMCAYPSGYAPCSSGPPPAAYVPPPYDPLPDLDRRYQAALARLSAQVRGLEALTASGAPATMEELNSRLDVAFVGGAYRLDALNARRNHLSAAAYSSQTEVDSLREEANRLEANMASAAGRRATFLQQRDAARAKIREAEATIAAMTIRTAALNRRSDAVAANIVQWVTVAAPPKARLVTAANAKARGRVAAGWLVPEFGESAGPARLNVSRPPLPVPPERGVAFRAPPGGSVEEKLVAVERLPGLIETAARAVDALNPQIGALEAATEELTLRVNALKQQGDAMESEIWTLKFAASAAEDKRDRTVQNERTIARDMVRTAVETWALQTLRDEVAIPAVQRLVKANATPAMVASLTNRRVGQMYAAGRSLIATPVSGTWKNLEAFMATEKVILKGLQDPFDYITAAAEELSSTGRSRADALGAAICAGQTRHAMDITEAAGGALPGPVGEIARGMVDGACR
ncbi:MAG: hypothetical protein WC729_12400 [Sphingomonas sp.]|jgi:hypothetical protein|uniref:hypothetical protein n=1 Tax=Sphingomonas sp. TaxID=28214 RepID=UPI003567977B